MSYLQLYQTIQGLRDRIVALENRLDKPVVEIENVSQSLLKRIEELIESKNEYIKEQKSLKE